MRAGDRGRKLVGAEGAPQEPWCEFHSMICLVEVLQVSLLVIDFARDCLPKM
jgi:hypothetical protein